MKQWIVLSLLFLALVFSFGTPSGLVSDSVSLPEGIVGGMRSYYCMLLGIAAGLAFATGNALALFGTLVTAHIGGCF